MYKNKGSRGTKGNIFSNKYYGNVLKYFFLNNLESYTHSDFSALIKPQTWSWYLDDKNCGLKRKLINLGIITQMKESSGGQIPFTFNKDIFIMLCKKEFYNFVNEKIIWNNNREIKKETNNKLKNKYLLKNKTSIEECSMIINDIFETEIKSSKGVFCIYDVFYKIINEASKRYNKSKEYYFAWFYKNKVIPNKTIKTAISS